MCATKQSVLTRKRNELPELLEVGADVDYVKYKVSELNQAFENFNGAHELYTKSLVDVGSIVMCHVFDWNGPRFGMAHKCACSNCIGRWPKTPQLLPNKDLKR